MDSCEERFRKYYDDVLAPVFQDIAECRAKNWKILKRESGICLAAAVVCTVLGFSLPDCSSIFWIFGGVAAATLLACLVYYGMGTKERALFKSAVIPKLIRFFDPSLTFRASGFIDRSCYEKSELFRQRCDIYRGEDLVYGYYHGVHVHFSELETMKEETYRDKYGRQHTRHIPIFDGVFFVADFQKDFQTRTFVFPDTAEKIFGSLLGNFFQKHNFTQDGSLVKLEDPDFEREFVVYADDQVEARYILTPLMMQQLLALKKRLNKTIRIAFSDSCMFLAIERSDDLFELDSLKDSGYRSSVICFNQLLMFLQIVDDLKMNVRIWTKR